MAEPTSILSGIGILTNICDRTSQYLTTLRSEIDFAQITISLLCVECSITSWGVAQIEQAVLSRPLLLATMARSQKETIICFGMGIDGVVLVFSLLDEELNRIKAGLSKPDNLDSAAKARHEETLEDLAQRIRDQGSSINILLALVKLNGGTNPKVQGISPVARASLERNHDIAKSLRATLNPDGKTEADLQKKSDRAPPKWNQPSPSPRPDLDATNVGKSRLSDPSKAFNGSGSIIEEREPKISDTSKLKPISTRSNLDSHSAIEAVVMEKNITEAEGLLKEALVTDRIPLSELNKGAEFSLLARAIEYKSVSLIQTLINYGIDLEATAVESVGYTALHWAVSCNRIEIVKLLLQAGSDAKKRSSNYGETALSIACRKRHFELTKILIEHDGISVLDSVLEIVNVDSRTPVLEATIQGFSEIVELLLKSGASPRRKDGNGHTALHIAAKDGNATIAKLAIEHGADIDARDAKDKTPLHIAATFGHCDIAQLLMERGTELDAKDAFRRTPLHLAVREGRIPVAELLIKWTAELEVKDVDERTPLHIAIHIKRHDLVAMLLESGALTDAKTSTGKTPLMRATTDDDVTSMKILCKHGADIKATNTKGWTAVHISAEHASLNALKFLISQGADIEQTTTAGSTPLMLAAQFGSLEIVKELLNARVHIDDEGPKKSAALFRAALNGHESVCNLLLDRGASIETMDSNNQTPLLIAASNDNLPVVKLLLSRGANIDAQDKLGISALYHVARKGNAGMLEELINAGASINIKTKYGANALHTAAAKGNKRVAEMLLVRGLDRNAMARHKEWRGTPAEVARSQGHGEIADIIEGFCMPEKISL